MPEAEEFDIACRPRDRRLERVLELPRLACGPLLELPQDLQADGVAAHDAALADLSAAGLELRLDQRDNRRIVLQQREHWREHQAQRNEGHVDHGQIGLFGQLRQVASVGALHHHHPRVVPEFVVQLPITHIHRVDALRATLQEQVGEAAGGGAYIDGYLAAWSFSAPRLTYAGPVSRTATLASAPTAWAGRVALCASTVTFPLRISACASSRVSARPRWTSRRSSRVRLTPYATYSSRYSRSLCFSFGWRSLLSAADSICRTRSLVTPSWSAISPSVCSRPPLRP